MQVEANSAQTWAVRRPGPENKWTVLDKSCTRQLLKPGFVLTCFAARLAAIKPPKTRGFDRTSDDRRAYVSCDKRQCKEVSWQQVL